MDLQLCKLFGGILLLLSLHNCQVQVPVCEDGKIRLVEGNTTAEGRVEVCSFGTWGTVCDVGWDTLDAKVVCRQLGYPTEGAVAHSGAVFGEGAGRIIRSNSQCTGNEDLLVSCTATEFPLLDCSHSQDAGVTCPERECNTYDLRLVDMQVVLGVLFNGRLEICISGTWRRICGLNFDRDDTIVACRELGYSPSNGLFTPYQEISSNRVSFACEGSESKLGLCTPVQQQDLCRQHGDTGVTCFGNCVDGELRLAGGYTSLEGRVEVCSGGRWGTVCDDLWDSVDARVTCTNIRNSQPIIDTALPVNNAYSWGSGPIHISDVQCTGSETTISACPSSRNNYCFHKEDAAVTCSGVVSVCKEDELRLLGRNPRDGLLQVCRSGNWIQVSNESLRNEEAQVACRQLGYSAQGSEFYDGGTSNIGVSINSGRCNGDESNFTECIISFGLQRNNITSVGIRCNPLCYGEEIRLVGGRSELEGRVEVCAGGRWGTVCDDDWDTRDATVVCRQLGFNTSDSLAFGGAPFGEGTGLVAVSRVECNGDEAQLALCRGQQEPLCLHSEDAAVKCTCFNRPINGVQCDCRDGFLGGFCEQANCVLPCQNGGICNTLHGTCSCLAAFTGEQCEINNYCSLQPCMNDGTCAEQGSTYTCSCPVGFTGHNCTDIDMCTSLECLNGGTCKEVKGETSCNCLPGFYGATCSEQVSTSCPADMDNNWNLMYAITMGGETVSHPCTVITTNDFTAVSGNITRTCGYDGVWGSVSVSSCRRADIVAIERKADEIFSQDDIQPEAVDNLVEDLANATTPRGDSQFPRDLEATSSIVDKTVQFLQEDLNSLTPSQLRTRIVRVMSNTLDEENIVGWNGIAKGNVGSESLLNSAEIYGNYFALALVSDAVNKSKDIIETRGILEYNIELRAAAINRSNIEGVLFPEEINADNAKKLGSAQSLVPASFLVSRGAEDSKVNVVNILFNNLETILPRRSLDNTQQPVASVISTQVITTTKPSSNGAVATFHFITKTFGQNKTVSNATCVFFKLEDDLEKSSWSTENVVTTEVVPNGDNSFNVTCESSHLTSFSILVNVNNVDLPSSLSYITYIGLGMSIVCLILTIVFLLIFICEEYEKNTHFFIHLNLCIALLLGYVTFLAGVQHARVDRIACALVAGLLHYFFTAAFCWMLCEGIMLYLMLVVVFTQLKKKWWLFTLIGWGPPLIIVGVSVAIIHRQYGTEDYCWISTNNPKSGAIWAFVLPMLVVIIINVGFLIAALVSLYKARKDYLVRHKSEAKISILESTKLFRQLFVACIILLPLLGLTWVFGLLAVNQSTIVFAYIFTILNSLQGLFFFFFHVIRSEKVWGRIFSKKKQPKTVPTDSKKTTQTNTSNVDSSKIYGRSSIIMSETSSTIEMEVPDSKKENGLEITAEVEEEDESFIAEVEEEDESFIAEDEFITKTLI